MIASHPRGASVKPAPSRTESREPDKRPTPGMWAAVALEWWFLALLAYHLILEHRVHLQGALPYILVLATVPIVIVFARYQRKRR